MNRGNSFRNSNSSLGSSGHNKGSSVSLSNLNLSNLNLSKHATAHLLQVSDHDPKSSAVGVANETWDTKSKKSTKSARSDNSATSNTGSNLGRLRAYKKQPQFSNHSSHPSGFTDRMDENAPLPSNSEHNESLSMSDMLYSPPPFTNSLRGSLRRSSHHSEEKIEEDEEWGKGESRRRISSIGSSEASNELDMKYNNSKDLLAKLGDEPSEADLCNVAAIRVSEVIQKQSMDDRTKFAAIPQYSKTDVMIGKHLGKGSFSDVFDVTVTIVDNQSVTPQSFGAFKSDLDQRIQAKFGDSGDSKSNQGSDAFEYKPVNMSRLPPVFKTGNGGGSGNEDDDLDNFANSSEDDDLDKEIDAMFDNRSSSAPPFEVPEFKTTSYTRPSRRQRRVTSDLGSSVCIGSMASSNTVSSRRSRRVSLAMKCLRPKMRSTEQFMIGVEDLVHETVMLSSLDHPNIIKLHGRAGGDKLGDGYFILLDKLQDTLDDRLKIWLNKYGSKSPPALQQVKVAKSVADALTFLHDNKIVFRDLKPANVGFDGKGVLKLFDFGFAIGLDQPRAHSAASSAESDPEDGLLYDRAGTPRYMAPEVGLDKGYELPADVYSFSILLWEIFALKKPFPKIKTVDEFTKVVFEKGERPKVGKGWPQELKIMMNKGWSEYPNQRPSMKDFTTPLTETVGTLQRQGSSARSNGSQSMRASFLGMVGSRRASN